VNLVVGDVVTLAFPQHHPAGHEQEGVRPAIVVAIPPGHQRFGNLVVVPMTTDTGEAWVTNSPALYLRLPANIAGFKVPTIALIDQVRTIDADRVDRWRGVLPAGDLSRVGQAIYTLFGELLTSSGISD
jgi:mRNA interferase MazF